MDRGLGNYNVTYNRERERERERELQMIFIYAQESGSLQYDFVRYKFAPCLAAYKCSQKKKSI